jgi:hypothetical protein
MLFVTKNGTRKRATDAIRPMIKMVDMTGGIPTGFWEDPVILGFLNGSISGVIHLVSNGKYAGASAGEISIRVFEDLLGAREGMIVSKRNVALLQDEEYADALKSGYLSVMVAWDGPDKLLDQPIVIQAIERSKTTQAVKDKMLGTTSHQASVASAIQELVYGRRIEELRG